MGGEEDLVAALQQQTIVGGDIGLALSGVDDQGVYAAGGLAQLLRRGKAAAAHAGNTCLPHPAQQQLQGDLLGDQGLGPPGPGGVLAVVLDDDGGDSAQLGVGAVLNGRHPAGDAGVDGGLQPPADGHRLSHLHRVSRLHRRQQSLVPAGGQGQIDPPGGLLQLSDGLTPGILFVWSGIDPAEEGTKHEKTSKHQKNGTPLF